MPYLEAAVILRRYLVLWRDQAVTETLLELDAEDGCVCVELPELNCFISCCSDWYVCWAADRFPVLRSWPSSLSNWPIAPEPLLSELLLPL